MRLHVAHRTHLRFADPASEARYEARIMPLSDDDQSLLRFEIGTTPRADVVLRSGHGGTVHHIDLPEPHAGLTIEMQACVETRPDNPLSGVNPLADDWRRYSDETVTSRFTEYLAPTPLAPHIEEVYRIAEVVRKRAERPSAASFVVTLSHMLHHLLKRHPGARGEHITEAGTGLLQDLTHTMLAVCRSQGIPARYVSGYLYQTNGGPATRAENGMHAWVECLLFTAEDRPIWRGFDPLNDRLADDRYVNAHLGRDYHDVTPVKGAYRGTAAPAMEVNVQVRREEQ